MVRISRNNLSNELKTELDRLSTIGDLVGGVDTYEHLPTENDEFTGTGVSLISSLTQIKAHDLVIVSDATGDGKGRNAVYEADTSNTEGDGVTWSFVMNMIVPLPKRTTVLSTTVPAVVGSTPPTVTDEVKTSWTNDPQSVEVFVNGLYEPAFTINNNKKLVLTNYPTTGWTDNDIVEVFIWKAI
jgi:hypothetical protein